MSFKMVFTVSCNVNISRRDVHVHQVVDDSRLDVALVFVDQNFLSGVEDLDEAVILFRYFVDRLVLELVMLDALAKVLHHVV